MPALAAAGFDLELQPLFDTALFRLLYRPGTWRRKAAALLSRTRDRVSALGDRYDMALIHREAYPIGPPADRALARRRRVPIVYDFDDAVYLPNTSDANKMIGVSEAARRRSPR